MMPDPPGQLRLSDQSLEFTPSDSSSSPNLILAEVPAACSLCGEVKGVTVNRKSSTRDVGVGLTNGDSCAVVCNSKRFRKGQTVSSGRETGRPSKSREPRNYSASLLRQPRRRLSRAVREGEPSHPSALDGTIGS